MAKLHIFNCRLGCRILRFLFRNSFCCLPLTVPFFFRRSVLIKSFSFLFSMADVEVSDQKKCFEDSCKSPCATAWIGYQECIKRIKGAEGDETETKHCTGQYFDYWSCVDKCVAPKLFPKLK